MAVSGIIFQMITLFIMMFAGYLAARAGLISPSFRRGLSSLVLSTAFPCCIVSAELQSGAFSAKQPNTVLIFGGTNDFWAGAPLGKLQFENWTDEDLKCTLPAFCCLLHTVKQAFLKAKIVVIINDLFSPELTLGLKQGCEAYQVPFVALRNIKKQGGHPNKVGMTQIFEQLYHRLENC